MRIQSNNLKALLVIALVLLAGVGIAYAALSTTLTMTFGNVTQNALTWNVGFTGSSATATEGGTSSTGRICGAATITANSVTVDNTTLSKPGDSCTYALKVKNSGTMPAKFNTITPTAPTGITCQTASGGNLVCGNITYKLTSDAAGANIITTGNTVAVNTEQNIYLVIIYSGEDVNDDAVTQSGAKFTLNYIQA